MKELRDLGLVGITDDEGDAREGGDFFRGPLGVASGDNDARGGARGVNFADGVASLGVSGGGNRAGVEYDDIGRGTIDGGGGALFAELALDGGAVGLRGAAAKLLDEEGAHKAKVPNII